MYILYVRLSVTSYKSIIVIQLILNIFILAVCDYIRTTPGQ